MLILKSVNFEQQQFQKHHLKQAYPGQTEWVIGRSTACDLVLANPEVSRLHGRIVFDDHAYYFIDLGSTSGSVINGDTVPVNDPRQLQSGDLLQLGETFLYVEGPLAGASPAATDAAIAYPPVSLPEQLWADEDLLCRCCRIVDETPDVKTFFFVAEPGVLFTFQPGQFANLEVEIDGKPVIRSYSISSSPTRPYHLSVTVKRVPSPADQPELPAGLVSNWLHDHLKVGDRVKLVGGPLGHFTCLPNLPAKMLLISAGSGITPMMSMSRWVQDAMVSSDIIFLHSARSSDDIPFRAELEAIAAQVSNFHLAVTVTQQPQTRSWMGLTGRISESMLQLVAPDLMERAVYVCGPEPFMRSIRSLFGTMQFPMENYMEESFGGKKPITTQTRPAPAAIPQPDTLTGKAKTAQLAATNGNGQHGSHQQSTAAQPATARAAVTTAPVIHFTQSERKV